MSNLLRFLLLLGAALLLAPAGAPAAERKPNIVVIVADDLGYADLGCQGCKDVPTPHIDSLAKNGVRCTNGYVSCPVCSPTRAGLMTGRYQQRFGHEFNPGPAQSADPKFGLPLTEKTMADRLKALGYATGAFGKWHLGYRPEYHPLKRGFDEFFGFLGGAHRYLDPLGDKANPLLRGTEPVDDRTYTTEAFAREAVRFIDKNRDRPFFLYLPFNAVHNPQEATAKYLSRFKGIKDEKRHKFAAMLSAMDDAVGQVLGKLRDAKLEEQTLLFFFSDNGGPTAATSSRNDPLSGHKGQVYEGGIRIPFLVQWKGQLPAGTTYDQPVIQLDILPTALIAAGGFIVPDWKLDGVNLLPYLKGDKAGPPHDRLFWRFGERWAVRMGDWKLRQELQEKAPKLFNLDRDIAESKDLAAEHSDEVKRLQAAYDAWNAQLSKPLWNVQRGKP
jgi:arylsulfatase A-like enzyme